MTQTYSNVFQRKLAAAIQYRIGFHTEIVTSENVLSYEEYRTHIGCIAALRYVLNDIFPEVEKEMEER